MNRPDYDYYYQNESEQFNFYRIPKVLITGKEFKKISCEAKVLYGLMLDRMGLSIKNDWVDNTGRVFIIFTLSDAIEMLGCGKDKGVQLFKELDEQAGLIERKKQGQGRPSLIYVKNFVRTKNANQADSKETSADFYSNDALIDIEDGDNLPDNPDFGKSEVKSSGNQKSALRKKRSQDFGKSASNYTNINNTELSDTDIQSINLDEMDGLDNYECYKELVMDNIDYAFLVQDYDQERVDQIVTIIMDAISTEGDYLMVAKSRLPTEVVRSQLLKLNKFHIEYVFESLDNNTTSIGNIKAYLLTTLYNAASTMDQYFRSLVQHDQYSGTVEGGK